MSDKQFEPKNVGCYIRPVQKRGGKSREEDAESENISFRRFDGAADNFATVMGSLLDYARQGLEVSNNSLDNNLHRYYQGLIDIAKSAPKRRANFEMVLEFVGEKGSADEKEYVVPVYDLNQAFKVQDCLLTAVAAPRILCSSILQQFVNTWEGFVGSCLSLQLECQKKLIDGKLGIPYESVRNIRTVSDLHRFAIEQTVGEVMRKNTREQLSSLATYFGIDVLGQLKEVKSLEEIVYRRHMLVHCDGIANDVYRKQVSRLGFEEPKVGADISPSFDYLFMSWDEIFSTGVILAHLIATRTLKSGGRDAEKLYGERADGALLSRSYMALEKRRFRAVQRIGEYARPRSMHDEWAQKALYVNLALAYKELKKEKDYKSIMDALDERSCPSDFAAPIACLHGDFDKAFQIVKRGCKQRDYSKAKESVRQLIKWPVYAELRKTSKCAAFLESVDIKLLVAACENLDSKIDFGNKMPDPKGALKDLYTLCQGRANS